ncbi:MAG TPA: LysR family transcriptional regulator [Blastocatellia bacterium]|nr:LysR family transcriptional regulator [Blastocatellia bacterium]
MELRLLRTFKAVAEAGSFTHAASRIHLTQAAVSVHIRQLEEEIGSPLFLRVNKKLFLTETGRALLSHAENILRAHDQAKAELAAMGGPSRGRLHIGVASTAITVHPLPEILSEIKRKYALLDLSVIGGTSEWIIEQILSSQIDAGLVSLPVEASDVTTETLRSDKLVAAMSPDHRLARARVIAAEELAEEPLILGEKGGNTRRLIDLFFEKSGLTPQIVMELQRTEAIIKMVELNFGVTILPQEAVRKDVARSRLKAVPVRDLNLRWEFGVAYLKSDYLPQALESFINLCRAYIANPPGE